MTNPTETSKTSPGDPPAIVSLSVAGFKSIADEQTIEIRPLTLLAGSNSSGKSSIMQPLLLLKQTLEAPYDPGPLLLIGPHVRFTSSKQMLSRIPGLPSEPGVLISLARSDGEQILWGFTEQPDEGLDLF